MAKDNSLDFSSSITGNVLGTASIVASSWMVDQTSLGASGSGVGDTSAEYQEDPDLFHAVSFAFGIGSSTEASVVPSPDIIVYTLPDNKPHSKIEEKAKNVYDKYNKSHTPEKDEGTSMIIIDSEAKALMDEIITNSKSKIELISIIKALEESMINSNQENTEKPVVKVKNKL